MIDVVAPGRVSVPVGVVLFLERIVKPRGYVLLLVHANDIENSNEGK